MAQASDAARKKRKLTPGLTRRTHTKSRSGCHPCKRRKIRCSGEHPSCQNCLKRELACEYVTANVAQQEMPLVRNPPRLLPQPLLLTNSDVVTFTDLRLLHHFLTVAYPHLPAENDSIWISQIPQIAHQHTYLMHALLGLSASHLHRVKPDASYHASAVSHRGHAIAGLNTALTNLQPTCDEADAMVAAAYSLTFQSTYMEDGLVDFMTMVRGCALITEQIQSSHVTTSFSLKPDAHIATLEPGVSHLPLIDPDILTTGLQSLSRVSSILRSNTDLEFFFALKKTLTACLSSTRQGFIEFSKIYAVWFTSSAAAFNELIDPMNETAKVLLCYFTVIQMLMAPVTMPLHQPPRRAADTSTDILKVFFIWAKKLVDAVPLKWAIHLSWPEAVVALVEKDIESETGGSKVRAALIDPRNRSGAREHAEGSAMDVYS